MSEFVYYYLKSAKQLAEKHASGTTFKEISARSFANLPFPLPPLPEQQKIVSKIEELFSELDSGVASLKKAKEQIKTYRQAVLASAFSGKLNRLNRDLSDSMINRIKKQDESGKSDNPNNHGSDNFTGESTEHLNAIQNVSHLSKAAEPVIPYGKELPEGWKWVKLGEIIDSLQYGTSDKANNNENGIPVLRMGNIQEGKLDYSSLKYFDKSYKELSKYLLDDGDLLFNRTNSAELVGKTALYKKHYPKSIFASYLIRVKVNKSIYSSDFLNYYINSLYGKNYMKSVVSQNVGQANVNGTKLKNMEVPLISLSKQNQIVKEIEMCFSEADNLEKAIDESLAKAETLRQSILKQAFEGRLVQEFDLSNSLKSN